MRTIEMGLRMSAIADKNATRIQCGWHLKNLVAGHGFEPWTFGLCLPLRLSPLD
jgi:hypothetical protein